MTSRTVGLQFWRFLSRGVGGIVLGLAISWPSYQLLDRSPPVKDAHVTILSEQPIKRSGLFEVDISTERLRACRTDVSRVLIDSKGTRFVLPELILPMSMLGHQHSSSVYRLPFTFAPGRAHYVSNVSYACNWMQRVFWPITVPERTADFDVADGQETPQ